VVGYEALHDGDGQGVHARQAAGVALERRRQVVGQLVHEPAAVGLLGGHRLRAEGEAPCPRDPEPARQGREHHGRDEPEQRLRETEARAARGQHQVRRGREPHARAHRGAVHESDHRPRVALQGGEQRREAAGPGLSLVVEGAALAEGVPLSLEGHEPRLGLRAEGFGKTVDVRPGEPAGEHEAQGRRRHAGQLHA